MDCCQDEGYTLNALLTEMDGFTGPSPDRPVFVLAATNFSALSGNQETPEHRSQALDPALGWHFSRSIWVDLPYEAACQKYFAMRLATVKGLAIPDLVSGLLAEKSTGTSKANLEAVIEYAGRNSLQKNQELIMRKFRVCASNSHGRHKSFQSKSRWDLATRASG